MVRPAGSEKTESEEEKMEQRMAAVEKFTSEQLKWNSEIKAEIMGLKERMLELKEIKEMLRDLKKGDRRSEGGESSVNGEERVEEPSRQDSQREKMKEGEMKSWGRRVELPGFEGEDPMGWLARAEKFFEVQNVIAGERLKLAFISMEGSASPWFSFWRKNSKNPSWEEFSMALNRRFGGKERSSVFEKLAKIKQNGRIHEYIQDFELLVSQAPQTGEEQLLGYFFAGLQSKIRNQIRPHDPKELMRAMEIALDVEESFREEKISSFGHRNNASFLHYQGSTGITCHTNLHKGNSGPVSSSLTSTARNESSSSNREFRPGEGSRNRGSRTLPYPEYVRREEGRCFHCGGAYGPRHRCPEKNLRVIICAEDEEDPTEVNHSGWGQIEEELEKEHQGAVT